MVGQLPGVDTLGDVEGKRVLVRCDLNVPLDGSTITDDGRIRASIPQLTELLAAGARLVIAAHLGRPKGAPDPKYSLAPVRARLAELLGRDVGFAEKPDEVKPDADVTLLENVRFHPGETSKDDGERGAFADELAATAELYVDDAF